MSDPEIGKRYTATPCATTGDRSYARGIHTVLACNATHVQTRYSDDFFAPRTVTLVRADHNLTPAESFEEPTGKFDLRASPAQLPSDSEAAEAAVAALFDPLKPSN